MPFSLLRRGSIKSISGLKQVTLKLFFQEKFQSERKNKKKKKKTKSILKFTVTLFFSKHIHIFNNLTHKLSKLAIEVNYVCKKMTESHRAVMVLR